MPCLRQVGRLVQEEPRFQDPIDPLGQCILAKVVPIRHRTRQPMTRMQHLIGRSTLLDLVIRMMDQRRLAPSAVHGHLQGLGYLRGLQRQMHVIVDDLG